MLFRSIALLVLLLLHSSPRAQTDTPSPAATHFHWQPASRDTQPRPWALLLPGASGLRIFDDDQHYFRFASTLNAKGIDVLIVDYREATKSLPDTKKGKPGPRISKIVGHAIAEQRRLGRMNAECPGAVIGWSLGGEGMWELAATPATGLRAAIGYCPSVRGQAKGYRAAMPVLVVQGTDDKITKPKDLHSFLAVKAPESANIRLVEYSGAGHGFDIESLGSKRKTLRYGMGSAAKAQSEIMEFLGQQNFRKPGDTGASR